MRTYTNREDSMNKRKKWLAIVPVIALVAVACSDDDDDGAADTEASADTEADGEAPADTETSADTEAPAATEADSDGEDEVALGQGREGLYCVATHEAPGDSGFWTVVKNGAEAAGADMGVEVRVEGDIDVTVQADIVRNCIADGAVGIAASLANPEGMTDALAEAVDAGLPVVTLNSGAGVFQELGAITHVGQSEDVAGAGAGQRMNDAGISGKVLCVVHEDANIGLEERCDGLESTYTGGEIERFNVASTGTGDIPGTQSTMVDKLTDDTDVAGILTLNPDIAIATRDAIAEAGVSPTLATFDLSPDVLGALEAGEMAFAIDQQQYLQGYLPIMFMVLFNENLNTVGGGLPVLTGPGFVTSENAADVAALSDAGTR